MPSSRTLRILSVLALAFLVLSAGLTRLRTNDLFIHLVTGGLILDEGRVPSVDRYSFTAPGARYVTHEWLAATWYALGERTAGPIGAIVASKVLPGLAVLAALLAAFRRTGVEPAIGVGVATAALAVARNRMTQDRPELIAIALLLALLWLLLRDRERALAGAPDRVVFWAAPLTALWANIHASFPLGIALVAAFALADRIDVLLAARDRRAHIAASLGLATSLVVAAGLTALPPASFGLPLAAAVAAAGALLAAGAFAPLFAASAASPGPRYALQLLGVAASMLAMISLNPQGPAIYLFPFEFTAGVNTVTERVGEWRPLLEASFLHDSFELSAYLVYLALGSAALAIAAARGVLDRRDLGVLLLFGVLPLRHIRWMALFALLSAPAIAAMLSRARNTPPAAEPRSPARIATAGVFGAAALAALLGVASRNWLGPPDPLFSGVLLLSVLAGTTAVAFAWVRSIEPRAALAAVSVLCALLALLGVVRGIPSRRGIDYQRGFQWSELDRVGGSLVPSAAPIEFLRDRRITGQLLTEYSWAGYAIYQLWPSVTVFLDSRSEVYGDELLDLIHDMRSNPDLARRALEQYAVDLVLVECRGYPYQDRLRLNAGILGAVSGDPAWGLLYFDDRSALYARREVDRPVELPAFLEGIDPRTLTPRTLARPSPEREAVLREATARTPRASFPRFALASLLHARGADDEALRELEIAWRANPRQPAAPALAGRLAEDAGDDRAARSWYRRTIEAAPAWKAIAVRLEALEP
ncbi:MAG: hypothetical protein VX681_17890 [Myxococcota bacterium]|nr:hypothetical protein [Myxococcota bacterium]